jgi:hypothetical protein
MRVISVILLLVLLLVALLIGGSPMAAQTATATFPPVSTATPILTATPSIVILATAIPGPAAIPTQTNGCYAPLQFVAGNEVVLLGGINVRSAPSLSGALVNYYPQSVELRITEGPVCANGYNWWHVAGNGEPGWVIEGKPGRYFLTPYLDINTLGCFTPLETIQVGGQLRTVTGSRVHQDPNQESQVVTVVSPGATLDVLDGPNCWSGLNWWRVRAPFGNTSTLVEGWLAEGFPDSYFVEGLSFVAAAAPRDPATACFPPLRLGIGSRVAAFGVVPRNLRTAPSESAPIVASLMDGIAFDVIAEEPVCADSYNWWQVRLVANGLTGWIAEGRPGNYFFDVLINDTSPP